MRRRFGNFILDTQTLELRHDDVLVPLEPRSFSLLSYLLEHADRVVPKAEIFDVIWEGRAVSDSALTTALRSIRKAFSDAGDETDYIQTYYGRGLRFVGDVDREAALDTPLEHIPVPEVRRPRLKLIGGAVLAALVLLGAVMIGFQFTRSGIDQEPPNMMLAKVDDPRPTIAVLPFVDLSQQADQAFFGAGLAEELINRLASLKGLRVVSRTSAFAFQSQSPNMAEIAAALGAEFVVEGSIRKDGESVRVTAQLIDTKVDQHLWSKTYDQHWTAGKLLVLQQSVTETIVSDIAHHLSVSLPDRTGRAQPENFTDYLKGLELSQRLEPEPLKEAITLFKGIVAAEPDFAPAYAGLVEASTLAIEHAGLPWWDTIRDLRPIVLRGVRRAPESPETYYAAAVLAEHDLRPDEALEYYNQAIALRPDYAQAHEGRGEVLSLMGQFEDALDAYYVALGYNPIAPDLMARITTMHLQLGQLEEATAVAEENARWNPDNPATLRHAAAIRRSRGDYVGAHRQYLEAWRKNPDFFFLQEELALFYVDVGLPDRALETATHPSTRGVVTALIGDVMEAKRLAKLDPDEYAYAALVSGEYDLAYWIFRDEATQVDFAGKTRFGLRQGFFFSEIAFILGTQSDPDAERVMAKLEALLFDRSPEHFQLLNPLLAGAAVHAMRNNTGEAIDWLQHAVDRGHVFSRILHHPVFKTLTQDPRYEALISTMEETAKLYRSEISF